MPTDQQKLPQDQDANQEKSGQCAFAAQKILHGMFLLIHGESLDLQGIANVTTRLTGKNDGHHRCRPPGEVPLGDGIDDKPAYTGPEGTVSVAPPTRAKLDSHYRDYRRRSIAQGVFHYHCTFL